ncbi:MAG: hypothetical protein OXI87_00465 [Albidovulum sp.]|nr:hypothetical protein [Albidovulum sp.]MDE0303346.1 hypothetical protein [Albidovulum sp.]
MINRNRFSSKGTGMRVSRRRILQTTSALTGVGLLASMPTRLLADTFDEMSD